MWLPIGMDVFAAIADPVRRDLLRTLSAGSARVVDLAAGRPISRPAVSKHLRVLAEAGLVVAEDVGRERHYRARPDGPAAARGLPRRARAGGRAGRPSRPRCSTPSTSRCAGSAVTTGTTGTPRPERRRATTIDTDARPPRGDRMSTHDTTTDARTSGPEPVGRREERDGGPAWSSSEPSAPRRGRVGGRHRARAPRAVDRHVERRPGIRHRAVPDDRGGRGRRGRARDRARVRPAAAAGAQLGSRTTRERPVGGRARPRRGAPASTTLTFAQRVPDTATGRDVGPGWEYYLDRLVAAQAGADVARRRLARLRGHGRALRARCSPTCPEPWRRPGRGVELSRGSPAAS